MWFKYLVEAWGVIIIMYAKLLTDADPYVLGFVYFACLILARGITTSYFSPLTAIASYGIGHMSIDECFYNMLSHMIGTAIVIITYIPVHKHIIL